MDKFTAGLLGAAASVATVGLAQPAAAAPANTADPMQVTSYADLLSPVPNAAEVLKAQDEAEAQVMKVDYYRGYYEDEGYGYRPRYYHHHHHHHHHHHAYYDRYHHHHHHHHHQQGAFVGVPGVGGVIVR